MPFTHDSDLLRGERFQAVTPYSLGHSISFDLDYVGYRIRTDQTFKNSFFGPDKQLNSQENIRTHLPTDIFIYTARTDYERPLSGKGKLSSGLKTSYVSTENAANYFLDIDGTEISDYQKTDRFRYRENINAANFNFSKELQGLSVQLGLRAENTNVNGHQMGAPSSTKQHWG